MDPIKLLASLRELITRYHARAIPDKAKLSQAEVEMLQEIMWCAEELDGWMSHHGFSPWGPRPSVQLSAHQASLLRDLIYSYGEHIAAGVPMIRFETQGYEDLSAIMKLCKETQEHARD